MLLILLTVPHRHKELFQPVGRLSLFFNKSEACLGCMIPFFLEMGEQGRILLSLSACFLEVGGFPFNILDLVGRFLAIRTKFSLVAASLALFATSCSSTNFLLTAAAARLLKYPSRYFMPHSLTPCFVSTPCVVYIIAAEFDAPNLTEPYLDYAFMRLLACAFCTPPSIWPTFCWTQRDIPSCCLSAAIFPW